MIEDIKAGHWYLGMEGWYAKAGWHQGRLIMIEEINIRKGRVFYFGEPNRLKSPIGWEYVKVRREATEEEISDLKIRYILQNL